MSRFLILLQFIVHLPVTVSVTFTATIQLLLPLQFWSFFNIIILLVGLVLVLIAVVLLLIAVVKFVEVLLHYIGFQRIYYKQDNCS